MKIAIVITSNEAETVWNAFRFGVFALKMGDAVQAFLLGKGVESERIDSPRFNVTEQMQQFVGAGGVISACGTCLKLRDAAGSDLCPVSTMSDLHAIVSEADKVLTF
jgi:uncharacterized protein involved in oxidation of intracellular sulfur